MLVERDHYLSTRCTVELVCAHNPVQARSASADRLGLQSLETFLPLHRSRHTWKNGVHVDVDLPLFPAISSDKHPLMTDFACCSIPAYLDLRRRRQVQP
jgi:hypothetical protein